MVSKRERRRWLRYIEQQSTLTDLKVIALMLEELAFARRMRRKAIRLSRKRDVGYIR